MLPGGGLAVSGLQCLTLAVSERSTGAGAQHVPQNSPGALLLWLEDRGLGASAVTQVPSGGYSPITSPILQQFCLCPVCIFLLFPYLNFFFCPSKQTPNSLFMGKLVSLCTRKTREESLSKSIQESCFLDSCPAWILTLTSPSWVYTAASFL